MERGLNVQLLGKPEIRWAGEPVSPPRGRKGWALLAYLVLSERPPTRDHLAELLFPEAEDPLAALRWSLSKLRAALGRGSEIEGDAVRLTLAPDAVVDVLVLTGGTVADAAALPGLGRPLLDGTAPAAAPAFELWLLAQNQRLLGTAESVLRAATHAALARGDLDGALAHGLRLARLNPLDENHHILLISCLRQAGREDEAREHLERVRRILREELGVDPSPALEGPLTDEEPPVAAGPAAIEAKLERGETAVASGALEEGFRVLRGAVSSARAAEEAHLLARALVALGDALVHAARGGDEEGAGALNEAAALAEVVGDRALGAVARREMAIVEHYRARYDHQLRLLDEATELAGEDEAELAWLELLRGAALSDLGDYGGAARVLAAAIERAERAGQPDAGGLAWSFLGRLHLLRRQLPQARSALERSIELMRAARWTAYLPWPEALLAEVELVEGRIDEAEERFERAFALGRELDDPCWEGIGARGVGLVAEARGDTDRALEALAEAPKLCRRLPDASKWIEAYALDAACRLAVRLGSPMASVWVSELETIAARGGMRELLARAMLHRAALGDPGALESARLHADGIDNRALHPELASAERSHAPSNAKA